MSSGHCSSDEDMLKLIRTSIWTKFVVRWSVLMCKLALQAVRVVASDEVSGVVGASNGSGATWASGGGGGPTTGAATSGGVKSVDIKRYARVEKVPGGEIEQSRVVSRVMLNKDITHLGMRRRIRNPRIVLLYKKGESRR
ncbi:hypothetical protein AMATHDRAFT_71810 [Amanita thiersii Skay4041]|uniref:Uncharacterized protein n=1 Tax=Amanita thiersii Skay4041 TaxID=703135 RepID=A0A2A9NCK6_9AGAR|nr:hypothetical protein AMATHDRAFT_71810 [Amanita thiersii Skay4041]